RQEANEEGIMARIRDILRQADASRGRMAATIPFPSPPHTEEKPRPAEAAEEIPFIEVGAVNQPFEASPSVLAVPLAGGPKKLMVVREQKEDKTKSAAPTKSAQDQANRKVVLRILPPPPPPLPPTEVRFAPELVTFHRPEHAVSQQYGVLAKELQDQLPSRQTQVLLFAPAAPNIDVMLTVLNLGIARILQVPKP